VPGIPLELVDLLDEDPRRHCTCFFELVCDGVADTIGQDSTFSIRVRSA